MKKTIIGIAIGAAALALLIFIARPDPQDPLERASGAPITQNASLSTKGSSTYDFGKISMARGNVSHIFKITNTDTAPVVIGRIYTSCMCTTASVTLRNEKFGPYGMPGHGPLPSLDRAIESGEEMDVEVIFDPAAHGPAGVGEIQRTVIIENSTGEPVELRFSAQVLP